MKATAIKVARVLLWLIYAWLIITLVLLFLAFLLELLGANPTAGFVDWVYRSVERAMAPFRGIFEPVTLSDKSTLDISVLFAMIVYGFVALGLHHAINWVTRQFHAAEEEEQRQNAADGSGASTPISGRVVQLTGHTGASASAVLTVNNGVTFIDLTVTGLEPSHSYGVWLQTDDGARASAGTFQPAWVGTVRVSLSSAAALADCQMFGVSQLPEAPGLAAMDVLATRL
jgi:uncharacterized protein YggT (Ycf19 family)